MVSEALRLYDVVALTEDLPERGPVQEVRLEELRARRDGGAMSGAQMIDRRDRMAGPQQNLRRDRPDVAGRARNENFHGGPHFINPILGKE